MHKAKKGIFRALYNVELYDLLLTFPMSLYVRSKEEERGETKIF